MQTVPRTIVVLFTLAAMVAIKSAEGQDREPGMRPVLAAGTLNLVLANKNGFVIAADSRMSSETPFDCNGKQQIYCDNSQKLFRTGRNSALVIAGFAVGRKNTPLDLAVASMLRRRFGPDGLSRGRGTVEAASGWAEHALEQALTGVAALYDPSATAPQNLFLIATFAGLDAHGVPMLRQVTFEEMWRASGPLNVVAPEYQTTSTQVTVNKFVSVRAGITCVADAILSGIYRSEDPAIRAYYQELKGGLLDNISLEEMRALAQAILRETRNFTPLVGGQDQIGVFPVAGDVEWSLPSSLPKLTQMSPGFMLWKGLLCTTSHPPCTESGRGGFTFFQDFQGLGDDTITKFFLASEFKDIPVALDNNYFVGSCFDGATLKWRGGTFFLRASNISQCFKQCALELPEGKELPSDSELNGKCRLIRKPEVTIEPTTVGAPVRIQTQGCVTKNSGGGVTVTAGGKCGNLAGIAGPSLQP
jgi:hypothetical protein